MNVTLWDYTRHPILALYIAYRTCYSPKTPQEIAFDIKSGYITPEQMERFILERLDEGHTSPLEHISFTFLVSGISRACGNELVRHHIGISFSQQSMRYVKIAAHGNDVPFVTPKTVEDFTPGDGAYHPIVGVDDSFDFYHDLIEDNIPPEDARYVLPLGTETNFFLTVNFAELLHIGDQRLCTRAQWEIRHLVARMRAEVVKVVPLLGKRIGPPCLPTRLGYCPESKAAYNACPLGRVRPHKATLLALWDAHQHGTTTISDELFSTAIEETT